MSLMRFVGQNILLEDFIKNYGNGIEYKQINFEDLVFSAFVHLKCMNCGMYRRNYHCLATPRWRRAKELLSKYNKFYLIYIKTKNKERREQLLERNKKMIEEGKKPLNEYLIKKFACNINQSIMSSQMRKFMVNVNKHYPSKKIRLFGAGGGCRSCKPCKLFLSYQNPHKDRIPCAHPDESFNSPESWGIDVYATLKNIGIDFEIIPVIELINVGMIIKKG